MQKAKFLWCTKLNSLSLYIYNYIYEYLCINTTDTLSSAVYKGTTSPELKHSSNSSQWQLVAVPSDWTRWKFHRLGLPMDDTTDLRVRWHIVAYSSHSYRKKEHPWQKSGGHKSSTTFVFCILFTSQELNPMGLWITKHCHQVPLVMLNSSISKRPRFGTEAPSMAATASMSGTSIHFSRPNWREIFYNLLPCLADG